jgi:hypothetical protein
MLGEMATVGDESIVSWQPHGKAFRVHLPDVFAKTVMPRYFKKQTKYKSFLRQLHIYGFHRIGKGIDRGAYFHSMFIQNKKSISLRMSCQKIKGEAANHYAAGDQDFYSSETNVDKNEECQDRSSLTNALQQVDPIRLPAWGCSQRGPATVFTFGSMDHRPDKEMPVLNNSAFLLSQEVAEGGYTTAHQLLGSDEIGLLPYTNVSRDEKHASPYHGYGSSASEKDHSLSNLLLGKGQEKEHGDEGFFAGKRFFHVVETSVPSTMEDCFRAVIK